MKKLCAALLIVSLGVIGCAGNTSSSKSTKTTTTTPSTGTGTGTTTTEEKKTEEKKEGTTPKGDNKG